ncbi:MAG: DUF3794 domain-containing protein [Clostridia bacterium]
MPSELEQDKFFALQKKVLEPSQIVVECKFALNEGIEKMLSLACTAEVLTNEVLSGEATFDGKVLADLVYLTDASSAQVAFSEFAFSGKILNPILEPNQKAIVSSKIIDYSEIEVNGNDVKVFVTIENFIEVTYGEEVHKAKENEEIFASKLSEMNVSSLSFSDFSCFDNAAEVTINQKIVKIISVKSDVILKEAVSGNDFVTLIGESDIMIVYAEDETNMKWDSAKIVVPFKEEIEIKGATKDMQVQSCPHIRRKDFKVELTVNDDSSVISISFPICATTYLYDSEKIMTISDVYSTKYNCMVATQSYEESRLNENQYFESKIDGNVFLSENDLRIDKVIGFVAPTLMETNRYVSDGEACFEGVVLSNVIYLNDETSSINSLQVEIPYAISQTVKAGSNTKISACSILSDVDISVKKGRDIYFDAKIKTNATFFETVSGAVVSDVEIGEAFAEKTHPIEIYFAKEGQTPWDIAKDMHESLELVMQQNPDIGEVMNGTEKIVVYHQKEIIFD